MKKGMFFTFVWGIALIVVAFDQIIKGIVNVNIPINGSLEIIKDFFSISNTHNYGAAWSMLWDKKIYIIAVTIVALIFVLFLLFREDTFKKYKCVYYGLLIGGILGNLIDRIFLGYVIDYLDFNFFEMNYPIFNFSDVFIVFSIIMICIECFFPENKAKNATEIIPEPVQEVEVLDFNE